jgi:phosphohistidine phosphatase
MRHAKSDWGQPGLSDFDRPLNERGRKAARLMGVEMRRSGIVFDAVLASPARRVRDTLQRFEKGYGSLGNVRFEQQIYESSAEQLLRCIRDSVGTAKDLLLVGHNPGQSQLAALLLSREEAERSGIEAFPTAAMLRLAVEVDEWPDLQPGACHVVAFLKPRELVQAD